MLRIAKALVGSAALRDGARRVGGRPACWRAGCDETEGGQACQGGAEGFVQTHEAAPDTLLLRRIAP